jgi:hypothetical protein
MEENTLSLTKKAKWEILTASKLEQMGISEKFHPQILQGIETMLPMLIIFIPCLMAAFFSKNEK